MKEQDKTYFENDFKEIGDRPKSFSKPKDIRPLANIRVRFKVEKRQLLSEGDLTISIVLVNESQEDLMVSNPLDSLQFLLQDEAGWPVKMPTGGPPRALINTRGDAPVDIVRPFKVEAIESSSSEEALIDRLTDEKFLLKKNTSYEFKIEIPTVQDSDKKAMTNTAKTKQIENGSYKLKILFQLLLSGDSPDGRQFESDDMDIELI